MRECCDVIGSIRKALAIHLRCGKFCEKQGSGWLYKQHFDHDGMGTLVLILTVT